MVSAAIFRFYIILLKEFRFDFSMIYEMFFNGFTYKPVKLLSIQFTKYFEIFLRFENCFELGYSEHCT
jgi:hypothetical protein